MTGHPVIQKTWQENILFSVLVELTYRCNLDCWFCYNDLSLRGRALSDDDYHRLLRDLADLQVMNLTFTGGEPLAHPSFVALGRHARDLGFVVRIKSNGHALRGALAEEIRREVDPFIVEISLHGASAEVHDQQTRIPGSFDRLMTNLPELRQLGFRIKLNATLTRWNEHQIEAMFELADRLGTMFSFSPTVTPRDDGDTSPLAIAPSAAGVSHLYRVLDARMPDAPDAVVVQEPLSETCHGSPASAGEQQKNCGAGASGLAVDPFGNVYPCVQWRRPLGNLHEQSIRDIWLGSPQLADIRRLNIAAKRGVEALGEHGEGLSHCMGISEEKTGDPLAIDPQAAENARLLRQMKAEKVDNADNASVSQRVLLPVVG